MDDVAHLTRSSDYSRFVARGVDESVKRAAKKKLISDPRFNVMDGLDTYIENYNVSIPIPESELRQMLQAKALRLFDVDEASEAPAPDAGSDAKVIPDSAAPAQVSQSDDVSAVTPDENADLRLQPDDAAGRPGAGPGPRPAGR
jgi:hypothetical protein